jgi:phage I-like protein
VKRFGTVIAFQGLPPSEFRIWPYGVVRFEWDDGLKLDLLFTPEDAQEVVRRAKLRQVSNELPIDYDHRTEMPVDNGPIPAAGWFSVEARDDGLWAVNVRWTPRAAEMLQNGEYRFWSPVFFDEENHIRELDKLALTNEPATVGARPLIASANKESAMLEKLRKLLGLPETATEEEVVNALNKTRARLASAEAVIKAAGIQADLESDEARGQAMALAASAQLAPTVAELQARIAQLEQGQAESTAEEIVEEALSAGKLLASQKAFWVAKAKEDPKGVRAYFASAAPVVPTQIVTPRTREGGEGEVGSVEALVMAQLGVSREAFLASRKRRLERQEGAE